MASGVRRFVPIVEWLPRYRRADLRPDVLAGVTVGAMLIPQAMAYAQLADLPPEFGLYASTLPLLLYAVFGRARQLAVGPVAIVSLMTASALADLDASVDPLQAAALLALLVALVHFVMGGLRLGWLTNFISHSVLVGFTAAAALLIAASQLRPLLGVDAERSQRFVESIGEIVAAIDEVELPTLTVGVVSVLALLVLRMTVPRFPGALAVVAGATALSAGMGLTDRGVAVVGDIPESFPGVGLPESSASLIADLLPAAVAITVVGFMESIAVAKVYARRDGYELGPNKELLALGMTNAGAGVLSGYPVTGSLSRTAVNADSGARTQLAAVITVAMVGLTIALLTPLLSELPLATLAAVVLVAVIRLVDVAELRRIAAVKPVDLIGLGAAFFVTLAFGVVIGIAAGAAVALVVALVALARPSTAVLGRLPGTTTYRSIERFPEAREEPGVRLIRIDAPLIFANTAWVKRVVAKEVNDVGSDVRALVIDCAGMNDIDSGGAAIFEEAVVETERRGVEVHLVDVKGPVRAVLQRSGLWTRLEGRLHYGVHEAVIELTGDPRGRSSGDTAT